MRKVRQKAKETVNTISAWMKKAALLVLPGVLLAFVIIALALFIALWDISMRTSITGIALVLAVSQIVTPFFAAEWSGKKTAAYNEKAIERLEELVELQNMTISYNEKVIERLEELVEIQKSRNDEN